MARPERNNVDYFPFICEEGKKMYYIEETYGNDGFASFVKILRELAKSENHYLDLSATTTLMFLSAKCKVQKDVLLSIIKDLVDLGKFDKVLWDENNIIWCQDFIDSIQDAYIKRKNKCITYHGLLHLLSSKGVRKLSKSKIIDTDNTQSIVEYRKEDKTKEDLEFNLTNNLHSKKENDFDVFWDKYGKKVDFKKSKEKFLKLSDKEIETLLQKVDDYVKSTPDIKYRKNPTTWLNGKCWQDDLLTPISNQKYKCEYVSAMGRINKVHTEEEIKEFTFSGFHKLTNKELV
jgi:hypothetical protein